MAFVAAATLGLSLLPIIFAARFGIALPLPFLVWTTAIIVGSVFMGEAFDFYERLWWWDIFLHGTSSLGFGLIGFLFIFMLFEGDRYAAPPIALAFLAFCFAMTIGAVWELFEYFMDSQFGLNMQKSGLDDTMGDIAVNAVGAGLAALSGFLYLKGRGIGAAGLIESFVSSNRRLYEKAWRKRRARRRS